MLLLLQVTTVNSILMCNDLNVNGTGRKTLMINEVTLFIIMEL